MIILSICAAVYIWFINFAFGGGFPLIAFLIYVAFISLFLLPLTLWKRNRIKLDVYVIFLLSIVVLAAVPWTPRDHFVRCLHRTKPGMIIKQTDTLMKLYKKWRYPKQGLYKEDQSVSYRHSNSPEYNCDIGEIYFRNGHVVKVDFSPD